MSKRRNDLFRVTLAVISLLFFTTVFFIEVNNDLNENPLDDQEVNESTLFEEHQRLKERNLYWIPRQKYWIPQRTRDHREGKYYAPQPKAINSNASPEVEGINKLLKGTKLTIVEDFVIPLALGSKLSLSNVRCDEFNLENIDHDHKMLSDTEATMDVVLKGLKFGCAARYQYQHGPFVRRPQGSVYVTSKISLDQKMKILSDDFNLNLPSEVMLDECSANTEVDVDFTSGSIFGSLINMLVQAVKSSMMVHTELTLCAKVGKFGMEAANMILENLDEIINPIIEVQSGDPVSTKSQIPTSGLEMINFMDSDLKLNYDDIGVFANDYHELIRDASESFATIAENIGPISLDALINGNRRLNAVESRNEASNKWPRLSVQSRRTFFLENGIISFFLDGVIGTVLSLVGSVLMRIIEEAFGSPEDLAKMLLDYLMELLTNEILGGDSSETLRARNLDSPLFLKENFSFNLFDLPFMPEDLNIKSENFDVIWNVASLSGSPIKSFSLAPISETIMKGQAEMENIKAELKFQVAFRGAEVDSDFARVNFPPTTMDLTLSTGARELSILAAIEAFIHMVKDEEINIENILTWVCNFFPQVSLESLELSGEFIKPTISGLFGPGDAIDDALNGFVVQFFDLFQSILLNAPNNFLASNVRPKLDDFIQKTKEGAEEKFKESVCV